MSFIIALTSFMAFGWHLLAPRSIPQPVFTSDRSFQEAYPPLQASTPAPTGIASPLDTFDVFLPAIFNNYKFFLPLIENPVIVPAVTLTYRSGQTFITWDELTDLQGETYRVYRSNQPINQDNLHQAAFLGEVGKDSARFYANRFLAKTAQSPDTWQWQDRFVDRYVIQNFGDQLPAGTGLLVWTLSTQDFAGATGGEGYYAVTVVTAWGEEPLNLAYSAGPVAEAVADPLPVEIHPATSISLTAGAHIFIQYMDLRTWNPTFHAPNPSNGYYGLSPSTPGVANDLQYAYDYAIYAPTADMCGGKLPAKLPVLFWLHGWRNNTYWPEMGNPAQFCAYVIMPQDESDTWYFGFAQHHDYRQGGAVAAGDTIVNYTEQRVLRMLYDLIRAPIGPAVDTQRVYVVGQSMGGSGALAFAERYPNVFAAAYASQPMTDFLTAGVTDNDWVSILSVLWGQPSLNLPVAINAPNHWADPLQKYNGTWVWEWQNHQDNVSANSIPTRLYDDMAPVGITQGTSDSVISWKTQGAPTYPAFNTGRRVWGAMVNNNDHFWQYYKGLPPDLAPLPYDLSEIYSWEPFWNLSVVKNETVPALSNLSGNSTAAPGGYYNLTVLWSSSWSNWDGVPIDQPSLWQISLCPVAEWSLTCGSGVAQTVDVTPRRVQHFLIRPGMKYNWQDQQISNNAVIASGTVTADSGGLLVIRGFKVSGSGNRLIIKPTS